MFRRSRLLMLALAVSLCFAPWASAATYYVDFAGGDNKADGQSPQTAWKHAPGDSAASGAPAEVELQPGDTVRFKGGVVYRGSIVINRSGAKGRPIVYDGNADGSWGQGKAVISGSVPLEGLKRCTSAAEAGGNPDYRNIYWTTVPKGADWKQLNVRQGLTAVAWSQDPNPEDPVFQEAAASFHQADKVASHSTIQVEGLGGIGENSGRPLISMFDGGRHSAIVHQMAHGAEVKVTMPEPVTVVAFGVTPQGKYVNPKEMSFIADGDEVLRVTLEHNPKASVEQRFELPAPVTFRTLILKFHSAHQRPGSEEIHFGAVQEISGYNAEGQDVLVTRRWYSLRDDDTLTQDDPDFYDNAVLAIHAGHNFVYYHRIRSFDPATHTITFDPLAYGQGTGGRYAIVNNPRLIDQPGEFALMLKSEPDGSHKLLVRPPDGTPENLTRGAHGTGISVNRQSYVTLQGFWIRKQGWGHPNGIRGTAHASDRQTDLVVRDCKVSHLRGDGAGIHVYGIDHTLVADCEVSENAGHVKGILLRNAKQQVTRGCTLHKNSSTALDYYTVHGGVVQNCIVTDNQGMHANGLTFYVGCRDILVERNIVRNGNVGMTLHTGENMIIRNNIIEGRGDTQPLGLWAGRPYDNILMTNNIFRHYGTDPDDSTVGIFGGNTGAKNYAIVNNIIDGVSGNILLKADMHHNIFTRTGPAMAVAQLGDNLLIPDLDRLYVDAAAQDYRPRPDSPAIDAGVKVTSINAADIEGTPRPQGKAVDIGPYELPAPGRTPESKPALADPHTWRFSFDGYKFRQPEPIRIEYETRWPKREGVEPVVLKGVDLTGEGGGRVNRRTTRGGYVSGWFTEGHWLEWTVDAPVSGPYEVVIEHGSETPATRKVFVNGQPVEGLEPPAFAPTGSWTIWGETGLSEPLVLQKGENAVRFEYAGGHLNFKELRFIPVTLE